jgi:cell wall-associated NlpC family hydrolase
MASREVNGIALGAMLLGGVFAYSGVKGFGVSAVIRNLVAGKDPRSLPVTGAIAFVPSTSGAGSTPSGFTGSGSSIVDDARKYLGVRYNWAHANPNTGWDCSGFVNWVLGHDLGMTLPMGVKNFSGNSHGPVAANYFVWTQATTVPRTQATPGDLACWPTHIGIVSGPNSMVNAYSTGRPTAETPIDGWGPSGEPLRIRRLNSGLITV